MERRADEWNSFMEIKNGDYNIAYFGYALYDGDRNVNDVTTFRDQVVPKFEAFGGPYEIYWYDVEEGARTLSIVGCLSAMLAFAF